MEMDNSFIKFNLYFFFWLFMDIFINSFFNVIELFFKLVKMGEIES